MLPNIRNISAGELSELVEALGQPPFRVRQLLGWLWKQGAGTFAEMTNLPLGLRAALNERYCCSKPKELLRRESHDGSVKYLLSFEDGVRAECVGIPSGRRLSVCVSSQAGCAIGCRFCATGALGLSRSLLRGEILGQVLHVSEAFGRRITNVVFMGQGEPFANYTEALNAAHSLNDASLFAIGARHITFSTCGIISGIERLSRETAQFTLAVSLHSAIQETRDYLMPGLKTQTLEDLRRALKNYSNFSGRRPSYEYVLIKGVNDSDEALQALVDFCAGTLCHVNLLRLNPVSGCSLEPAAEERVRLFLQTLTKRGIETSLRASAGPDIDAACGQLASRHPGSAKGR